MRLIEVIDAKEKLPTADCSLKGFVEEILEFAMLNLFDRQTGAFIPIAWRVAGFSIPKIGKVILIAAFTIKLIDKIVKCINNERSINSSN